MKLAKRMIAVIISVLLICAAFAGCSSNKGETYGDTVLIIGYTEEAAPFIESVNEDGTATGFIPELWKAIFDSVKGDLKSYRFEKVEEGYELESDGGFKDSQGKEYSAGLLMGAVSKNNGTFNEDYSFTEPIISDRIIAVVPKNSSVKSYADFAGKRVVTTDETSKAALEKQNTIFAACASVSDAKSIDDALAMLDSGAADIVITDEFQFIPKGDTEKYEALEGELDKIEYVIACAKHSGWKDSINEAIRELKSPDYNDGDGFTPIVVKYFGYDASSFDYETEGDE